MGKQSNKNGGITIDDVRRVFYARKNPDLQELMRLSEKLRKYVYVFEEDGSIRLTKEGIKLPLRTKVLLVLAARYIDARLSNGARPEYATLKEIYVSIDKEPDNSIRARINELEREGKVRRVGRGAYKITSIYEIEEVIQ